MVRLMPDFVKPTAVVTFVPVFVLMSSAEIAPESVVVGLYVAGSTRVGVPP